MLKKYLGIEESESGDVDENVDKNLNEGWLTPILMIYCLIIYIYKLVIVLEPKHAKSQLWRMEGVHL